MHLLQEGVCLAAWYPQKIAAFDNYSVPKALDRYEDKHCCSPQVVLQFCIENAKCAIFC